VPAFGLSFDPRALTDLLQAPGDIRDMALLLLQEVVNAERFGRELTGDLTGYRKLIIDHRAEWRLVYKVRPAPPTKHLHKEVFVVAVQPRARNDIYDTVGHRLGMNRRPVSSRTHAARSRSPQLTHRVTPATLAAVPQRSAGPAVQSGHSRAAHPTCRSHAASRPVTEEPSA
jgi:mRNA-degrading endonuclease RelE of RelBE toxin-antitoxin system